MSVAQGGTDRREGVRILIYGMNFAPELAGVGRYTGDISAYLAGLGHRVTVVTTPPHYPGWRTQNGYRNGYMAETVDGARVYRCPLYLHAKMSGVRRLLAPLSFALASAPVALWATLRSRPQVVLAIEPTLFNAPIALLLAWISGARPVLHVQDLEIDAALAMGHVEARPWLRRTASAFEALVMTRFASVVTISNRMAEKIAAKGVKPERLSVVRNWVDLERIRPLAGAPAYRNELGLSAHEFVVLYSGSIGAKQGIGVLLEAARQLSDLPRVRFVIAGRGPMRGEVADAAERLRSLTLMDLQPEARFGEFLSLADLHVLPQEREAADLLLPSKLGGLLASGKPIIITAEPDTELGSFVEDACDLIAPGDPKALADFIRKAAAETTTPHDPAPQLALAESLSRVTLLERFALCLLDP